MRLEELLREGAANVRNGRPGILSVGSEIGRQYEVVYEAWMRERAAHGDGWAKSLGY